MSEHHNKGKKFGRPFQPGQSGNPAGLPAGVLTARHLLTKDAETFFKLMHEYANIPIAKLRIILKDEKGTTAGQGIIARLYWRALAGSYPHLTEILNRVCGPIPKHVKMEDGDSQTLPSLHGYSADTLTAVMIKLKKDAEAIECNSQQKRSQRSSESSARSYTPEYSTE